MNKNKNLIIEHFGLILALSVEVLLLILILVVVLVGVLGIFMPILPGLLLFALAAGIYSLMSRSGYNKISSRFHPHLAGFANRFPGLKMIKNIMGFGKLRQKKKEEKIREEVLKNGLILAGFNLTLFLALFFAFLGLSALALLVDSMGVASALVPLVVIFLFAGFSAIVWYRFGQILGGRFDKRRIISTALVVLISILPLFLILMLLSNMIFLLGEAISEVLVVAFLGLVLLSVLSAVFEFLVVVLGVMSKIK